jgi:hypothetical protein
MHHLISSFVLPNVLFAYKGTNMMIKNGRRPFVARTPARQEAAYKKDKQFFRMHIAW